MDPVAVDEMMEAARFSGVPEFPRRAYFIALNQKAVARRYSAETGRKYEDLRLIVTSWRRGFCRAHMDGRSWM